MNERKLRNRLSWLARVGAQLSLLTPVGACGGIAEGPKSHQGAESDGSDAGNSGESETGVPVAGPPERCLIDRMGEGVWDNCWLPKTYDLSAVCAVPRLTPERCQEMCDINYLNGDCSFSLADDAKLVRLTCPPTCVAGRRPDGFVEAEQGVRGLAGYFARMAELEAAAVPAFRRLRSELHERGAPRSLLRALSRAARDERRHTRATRALARRHGIDCAAPLLAERRPRSLEAMAVENATEGCVRELFGALVATFQAGHAADPEVRRVMRRIAREETRHAALSLDLQKWLEARLDRAARGRVRDARTRALEGLAAELERKVEAEVVRAAGVPTPATAAQLFRALFGSA